MATSAGIEEFVDLSLDCHHPPLLRSMDKDLNFTVELVIQLHDTWRLQDLTGPAVYDRSGSDLTWQGLYLDMPAWGYHVFAVSPAE